MKKKKVLCGRGHCCAQCSSSIFGMSSWNVRVLFTAVGGAGFMGIEKEEEEDRCGVGSGEEVSQMEVSRRQLGT